MMMLERFSRLYRADLAVDDAGTVTGRVVPYESPAHVVDVEGDYDEVFTGVSFAGMLQGFARAPNRVRAVGLDLDHRPELDHRIGYATALESSDDGLYGTFALYGGADTPKVRSMLSSSHTGLSIDFGARHTRTRPDGTRERLGVHLFRVAATPTPIYAGAEILAVRADDEPGDIVTPRLDASVARWRDNGLLPSTPTTP
jgi:hypothetical protein